MSDPLIECACGCGARFVARAPWGRLRRFVKGHSVSRSRRPLAVRFWAKVDPNGPIHPALGTRCWIWTGSKHPAGYGSIKLGPGHGMQVSHRVAWELALGRVPDGLNVLHRCDNRPCVNPDHLFLGTQLDNARDMIAKGRQVILRGERVGRARLNADQVREIRRIGRSVLQRALAERYGVGTSTIGAILTGDAWKHVT